MAEAVVDGIRSKFFCHQCSAEIDMPLLPDYKCPLCSSGFIEELMNDVNCGDSGMDTEEADMADADFFSLHHHDFDDMSSWTEEDGRTRMMDGAQPHSSGYRSSRRRSIQPRVDPRSGTLRFRDPIRTQSLPRHRTHLRRYVDANRSFSENLIQDFIVNLTGMNFPIQGQQPLLNISLLLENHGDYVWGREGLDAIVTQLLNQMDGTGPPPLPKKQIEEIPTVGVTQLHVDSKLQCSVCWEDFILSENVKQLACQHLYHVPCIVPWLELHGTCPICRQNLSDQNSDAGNESQPQDTINLATIFSAANQSSNSSTTSSTSSPTSSTPSGSSTRTNFSN